MNIQLTANAGVFVATDNGTTILVDALHKKGTRFFCGVDDRLLDAIIEGAGAFSHIDFMLVTHDHPDHYDEESVAAFAQLHPETVILTPTMIAGINIVHPGSSDGVYCRGNTAIRYGRLQHEGAQYTDVVNYGYMLDDGNGALLFLGDAQVDQAAIHGFVGNETVRAAFLNFPFAALARGRNIIRDAIRPDRLILLHLPCSFDDPNGYISSTVRAVERYAAQLPPTSVLYDKNPLLEV